MTDQNPARPDGVALSRAQIMEYIREMGIIATNCELAGLKTDAHNLSRITERWFLSLGSASSPAAAPATTFPAPSDAVAAEPVAIPASKTRPGGKASCLHLHVRERCNDCPLSDELTDQSDNRVKQLAARLIGYVQARPDYGFDRLLAHVNETLSTFAYNEILNHRKATSAASSVSDREAIARIIDPEAFECLARSHVIPTHDEFRRMHNAKDRADAILSLPSAPRKELSDTREAIIQRAVSTLFDSKLENIPCALADRVRDFANDILQSYKCIYDNYIIITRRKEDIDQALADGAAVRPIR